MSNESGRQATARAEAQKLLADEHGIEWNDTGGYLAMWFEGGRSYTEALGWIKQGVLLPSDIAAAEAGDLPGKPEELIEVPPEVKPKKPKVHVEGPVIQDEDLAQKVSGALKKRTPPKKKP